MDGVQYKWLMLPGIVNLRTRFGCRIWVLFVLYGLGWLVVVFFALRVSWAYLESWGSSCFWR